MFVHFFVFVGTNAYDKTFVGSVKVTLRELIAESHWLTFVDPKKSGKAKYVNSGVLRVKSAVPAPGYNPQGPSQFNITVKGENVSQTSK